MSNKRIEIPLYLQNNKSLFFTLENETLNRLNSLEYLYSRVPKYNNQKLYRNNIIKTSISDIDIESKDETSYIESLAAICCKRIKNKNQKMAYNLLNLLEKSHL